MSQWPQRSFHLLREYFIILCWFIVGLYILYVLLYMKQFNFIIFFKISPSSFAAHPLPLSFQSSLPAIVDFLHPFSQPVSAGPVSPSPLCVMWWHLFTTQAAGCLLLCSVIWLLPFSEWGHSLGQQSTDRTRQHAGTHVTLLFSLLQYAQRPNVWPSIVFLVWGFSSYVCVDYRQIMYLSLSAITCYRNIYVIGVVIGTYVVIVTSLLGTSLESFISTRPLFWRE